MLEQARAELVDFSAGAKTLLAQNFPARGALAELLTVPADLSARGTTSQGVVHEIYWDFAAQFAADPLLDGFETLPDTHVDGFRIRTSIAGSGDVDVLSFALGNDPPAVENVVVANADPVEGIAGLVSVAFELRDSGGDPVDVLTV